MLIDEKIKPIIERQRPETKAISLSPAFRLDSCLYLNTGEIRIGIRDRRLRCLAHRHPRENQAQREYHLAALRDEAY